MSIRALAAELNISIGTVSRALNGRPDVNAKTRQTVLEAAERLGYAPKLSGTSLRSGRTKTIGFMIETTKFTSTHGESFFMTIFDGLQNLFRQHDLDLVVLLCGSEQDPFNYLKRIVNQRFVDGVILSGIRSNDERVSFLKENGLPFVTLGRTGPDDTQPWVDLDLEGMISQSVQRFAQQGYQRIGLVKDSAGLNVNQVFENELRAAAAKAGLTVDDRHLITVSADEFGGVEAATQLMTQRTPPDAVFLVAEATAIGIYHKLAEIGLKPGVDLGIIGQRRNPLCLPMTPVLTTFEVDLRALGIALGKVLLSHIEHFKDDYPEKRSGFLWPADMVAGASDLRLSD